MFTKRRLFNVSLIMLCLVIDQLSKMMVELHLPFQNMVSVFPSLALFRTYNEGVAFSFLSGFGSWGLVIMASLVCMLVLWLWRSAPHDRRLLDLGYGMIMGGALGNIIDRAHYGHVVDFILVYYGNWSFAIFNIADSFISVGVAMILLDEALRMRQKKQDR